MGACVILVNTQKKSFEGALDAWHLKWSVFLNERKLDPAGKKGTLIKN